MSGTRCARLVSIVVLGAIIAASIDAFAQDPNVTSSKRVVSNKRPRTRVLVERRSFLDGGTDVQPRQERKYLDYAFPPTHQPLNVVTNTGGRVGWHNSPMPGPFFPFFY